MRGAIYRYDLEGGHGRLLARGLRNAEGLELIGKTLLGLLILIAFYALVSWRSFIERERMVSLLRPLTSDALSWMRGPIGPRRNGDRDRFDAPALGIDAQAMLTALCRDSIGASWAIVLAQGPLAPLVSAPLQYPPTTAPLPAIDLAQLRATLAPAGQLGAPLEPHEWQGLTWAVPLWSERGPLGVMLLGPKADGGLYAQEDIEVARAGGERLLEALIQTELTNRLIAKRLEISPRTVEKYRETAIVKLKVPNSIGLLKFAFMAGIL